VNNIYKGILNKHGKSYPYSVRKLTADYLPNILHVQEQVVQHLIEKDVLQPLSSEEFQFILDGNGLMIGAFVGDELIAFRALLVPVIDEEHLGWDIGLSKKELPRVIYQEISNVLPEYRGNQLQKTLASLIMQDLYTDPHRYRYVCCTVAPFNIPSLKDKFIQGMKIKALKQKYGGAMRYIFVKDLEEDEKKLWNETLAIRMDDFGAQQKKLAEGWQGFKMEEYEGHVWVHYRI